MSILIDGKGQGEEEPVIRKPSSRTRDEGVTLSEGGMDVALKQFFREDKSEQPYGKFAPNDENVCGDLQLPLPGGSSYAAGALATVRPEYRFGILVAHGLQGGHMFGYT